MTPAGDPPRTPAPPADGSSAPPPARWPPKRRLFGVPVSETDYDEVVAAIGAAVEERRSALVAHLPVHGVIEAYRDPTFRAQLDRFDIVAPDGQPVRWALNRLTGSGLQERVYGPESMLRVCGEAAARQWPVYLLGSTPEVLERLAAGLSRRFPGLALVGVESPPFRPLTADEDRALVERVNGSGARVVFLGLGCPKQEHFAFDHRDRIDAVQVCVGAAFDFVAGTKPMAPAWMQRAGLEWLFRLWSEPARLWKRYLVTNTIFLGLMAKSLVLGRSNRADGGRSDGAMGAS